MKPPTSLTCATYRFHLKLQNQNSRSQSLKLLQATRALKVTKTCRFRYSLAATGGPSVRSSELLWKWWKEFKQAKHVPAYTSLVEFALENEKKWWSGELLECRHSFIHHMNSTTSMPHLPLLHTPSDEAHGTADASCLHLADFFSMSSTFEWNPIQRWHQTLL